MVADLDIKFSKVTLALARGKAASEDLPLIDNERSIEVKNDLLPVSILSERRRGKSDHVLRQVEEDVKPGNKSMYLVVPHEGEAVFARKLNVVRRHRLQVQLKDGA